MQEHLTKQQVVATRARATAPRDLLLFNILYETGCTVAELVELQISDLNQQKLSLPNRQAHISNQLATQIREHHQTHDSTYVFSSRQNPQLSAKRAEQIVKHLLKPLKLKSNVPQVIRYTHIVHAYNNNVSIPNICTQTGLGKERVAQIIAYANQGDKAYEGVFE